MPSWAGVLGALGIFLFLIGLLAFLIRTTETLTIAVSPDGTGSRVSVNGLAAAELSTRIYDLLQGSAPLVVASTHGAQRSRLKTRVMRLLD